MRKPPGCIFVIPMVFMPLSWLLALYVHALTVIGFGSLYGLWAGILALCLPVLSWIAMMIALWSFHHTINLPYFWVTFVAIGGYILSVVILGIPVPEKES